MNQATVTKLADEMIALANKIKTEVAPERPYPRVFRNISEQRLKIRQNPGGIGGDTRYINPGELIEAEKPEDGRDDHGNKCLIAYARQVFASALPQKGNNEYTANGKWRKSEIKGYVELWPEQWEEQIDDE